LSWYNERMSDGGFLEGFDSGASPSPEPASPEPQAPEPVQEAPAPVFVAEEPVDLGYTTEPGETMTPGQADRLALQELDQDNFLEQDIEQESVSSDRAIESAGASTVAAAVVTGKKQQTEIEVVKDEVYEEVEKIVEDGLGPFVETMEPNAKERFVKKGREITAIIAGMVRSMHVKTKDVFRLLKEWLLTIPGVNKFFLEQEVKIKTDRITELDRVRREESEPKL
jgi:hypothetical protein